MSKKHLLDGPRLEIDIKDEKYPKQLLDCDRPPKKLYVIGDVSSLRSGLAIVGARKASPYGISCAEHFGKLASDAGINVISGGAIGCDSASQSAALDAGGKVVAVLGGGCDCIYPAKNFSLFQQIINNGGAIISEHDWNFEPLKWTFRARNRLIATLAKATLIVEAGLPSGTFSTADDALNANRDVLVVPGAITSKKSRGANRLIYQGAIPIIDDDVFFDQMNAIFGCMLKKNFEVDERERKELKKEDIELLSHLQASPLYCDDLLICAKKFCGDIEPMSWLMMWIAGAVKRKWIAQYPDGRYGPVVKK